MGGMQPPPAACSGGWEYNVWVRVLCVVCWWCCPAWDTDIAAHRQTVVISGGVVGWCRIHAHGIEPWTYGMASYALTKCEDARASVCQAAHVIMVSANP